MTSLYEQIGAADEFYRFPGGESTGIVSVVTRGDEDGVGFFRLQDAVELANGWSADVLDPALASNQNAQGIALEVKIHPAVSTALEFANDFVAIAPTRFCDEKLELLPKAGPERLETFLPIQ